MNLSQRIKIGSLVRGKPLHAGLIGTLQIVPAEWIGIVIDFKRGNPVVHWSKKFPKEEEYLDQLEVIS